MLSLQIEILELVAGGAPLGRTLRAVCLAVEARLPDVLCSVVAAGSDAELELLAAPSLPGAYRSEFATAANNPRSTTAQAVQRGEALVAPEGSALDPECALAGLGRRSGLDLRLCSPILNRGGGPMGALMLHRRDLGALSPQDVQVTADCARLCAIALERNLATRTQDRLAYEDVLTGLANRAAFESTLEGLSPSRIGEAGLILVDLDNLKIVNDTFGHRAGDHLIQEASRRIAAAAAPCPTFRLGGDEFAVLIEGADPDLLSDLAQRILAPLSEPVMCDGHPVAPRASLGGACGRPGQSILDLRQHADLALYHAKETQRGGFVAYCDTLGSSMTRRLGAIRDVRLALAEGRIDAHYQPIVRLDTREIVGLEALFRLVRPNGEIAAAGEFFEATSDLDIATQLTARMLDIVASDIRAWRDQGIGFQHIGLNTSAADFHGGRLHATVEAALARHEVPLAHVILEVAETAYAGRKGDGMALDIQSLRSNGLRIALDDFGTGVASLTHMLAVPVDIIKIDRSFVARLEPDSPSAAIVEGLLSMAGKLGMHVVAEGVETEAQAERLQAFGCELGQGFLYSRAVDRHAITALLRDRAPSRSGPLEGGPVGGGAGWRMGDLANTSERRAAVA